MRWIFFLLLALGFTQAQDLIESDFTGGDLANNRPIDGTLQLANGVTTTGWDFGPGLSPIDGVDDRLTFGIQGTSTPSTLAEALADDEYLTISLSSAEPIDLSRQRMRFSVQRFSFWSAQRFAVLTNVLGFEGAHVVSQTQPIANGDNSEHEFSFIFPDGYDGLTNIEIRIYPFSKAYGQPSHVASLNGFSITDPGPVFQVTVTADHDAEIIKTPNSEYFTPGEILNLSVNVPDWHRFAGWEGDLNSRINSHQLTIESDLQLHAGVYPISRNGMEMGANPGSADYWASSWIFVDLMKFAGNWGGTSAEVPVDDNGYPAEIPFTADGETFNSVTAILAKFTDGDHTLRFEGTGTIAVREQVGGTWAGFTGTGGASEFTVPMNAGDDRILLRILASDSADPIRNIQLFMPGFDETTTFHPDFLASFDPFTTIRFMQWGDTNFSPLVSWEDRVTPDFYTQGVGGGGRGIAIEYMVELANTLGKDPWVCLPHLADDDYIRQLARLLRDTVDPDLNIYLEYSNETWNGVFSQTVWLRNEGQLRGLSSGVQEAGDRMQVLRIVRMWEIFAEEFGEDFPDRVIKVIGGWSAGTVNTAERVSYFADPTLNPNGLMGDALAVAPYFGHGISASDIEEDGYPTVDEVVDTMSLESLAQRRLDTIANRRTAANAGLRLIAYEGGQHFVGSNGAQNDLTLFDILAAANRDPRMGQRYTEYFDMLEEEGIENFLHWTHIQSWRTSGFWGALEYQHQPLSEAPKMAAILNWIDANPTRDWRTAPDVELDLENDELRFRMAAGLTYTLETSVDMETWIETGVRVEPSYEALYRFEFPAAAEARRFWRVRTE